MYTGVVSPLPVEHQLTGHLILIMAPSGSGKGVLLAHLRETFPALHFAVSCTTREPRPGERDGEVYHFVSDDIFDAKVRAGEFLEWAEFSGKRYGTLKSEILEPLAQGRVVIREIELQGILSVRELIPEAQRTILYVDAGAWDTLKRRIEARAPISAEHLALRKERFEAESKWKEYADVIIENKDNMLAEAKRELEKCVREIFKQVTQE